jgi:hypothetical protein
MIQCICNRQFKNNIGYKCHKNKCNGFGTPRDIRRKRKVKIYKEKSYHLTRSEAAKKNWKNPLYVAKCISACRKYKHTGIGSTKSIELLRRQKIRDSINNRYSNGWQPKAGRCKKIEYNSNIAGKVLLDGTWELAVAKFFDLHNIKWKRNTQRFDYIDNEKIRKYTPDFYLIDSNEYVEVKGYTTDLDKCKWKQFPNKLLIYNKEKLNQLKILIGRKINSQLVNYPQYK